LVEIILRNGIEVEQFAQGASEGIGVKGARGGEFGSWLENTGDDHGDDGIALPAGMLVDELVELQTVQGAKDSGDVAVRARADDVEGLRKRGAQGSGAFQNGAEGVELGRRPIREIGEGAVADLAVETEGLAEEDGGRGVAIGDSGDVHAYYISQHYNIYKHNITYYMTT
jgi:hypothetical protein